ncbi:cytochrome ubiquinol oxidase subunit I [Lactococcus termiticola]|uniref:Cytochrome D ubiquinol oxidase subunit I n=1 Tax=Lactococcus termiticola TaxID=2169526 RepID=A0A2R5HJ11_9LACT|nr:cytochrome ubiquinol oxidase subunit I [Lactococcus termiticola]GBG96448.1 cytochrome D ubiquinol oxidase subunit I [Lactococcus termiticola]
MFTIVNLARFQFAMTTVFHFFFVPFSIGMLFMVALMESIYVKTGDEKWKIRTKFFGSIMLLSFAVGVVTGIIQEFQFGMNWSDYSRFVGDIFGAPLAVEALLAFFMESTFLGIWLFGWDRINKKLHMVVAWITLVGSVLSGLWILAANSFMQNPVGFTITGGNGQRIPLSEWAQNPSLAGGARATLNNFAALVTNPQTTLEFSHVITGWALCGGFSVAGIAAFQLLKKRDVDFFKPALRLGLLVALIGSIGNFVAGDQSMIYVAESQPMKFAVAEGVMDTSKKGESAPWEIVAFFNEAQHREVAGIRVPMMLSILTFHSPTNKTDIKSVDQLNKELAAQYPEAAKEIGNNFVPPMNAIFYTFRIMAGLSMLMILASALGLFWTRKKKPWLYENRGFLRFYGIMLYAPILAITCGWLVTELGRYPWTVYGLFTIQDSVSPNVSVASLTFSNILYFVLFCGLAATMIAYSVHVMRQPIENAETAYAELDPFNKDNFKVKDENEEEGGEK